MKLADQLQVRGGVGNSVANVFFVKGGCLPCLQILCHGWCADIGLGSWARRVTRHYTVLRSVRAGLRVCFEQTRNTT